MNTGIKNSLKAWLQIHPKIQQWLWFVMLWFAGLLTVSLITYPLKFLINLAK